MKRVGSSLYVHRTALNELPAEALEVIESLPDGWDVVRVDMRGGRPVAVMLGWTSSWEDDPHPRLRSSALYKPDESGQWHGRNRSYNDSPIYHRKETMLSADHPRRDEFTALTEQEEAAGLLGRSDIGRASQWAKALESAGVRIVGHTLVQDA